MKVSPQTTIALPLRLNILLGSFAALAFGAPLLRAQSLYFDGTGPDNATQTGTWTTSTTGTPMWNTATDGSGTTTFWSNGDDAHFSVSGTTTPTTASNVTMGTAVSAAGLFFDVGATTITSGTFGITVGADGITVASGASGSVGNVSGAAGITTTVSETWTNNGSVAFVDGGGSVGGGTTLNTGLILATGNFQLGNTGQNNLVNGGGSITVDTGATLTADGGTSALASHPIYLNGGTIGSLISKAVNGTSAFLEANSSSSVGGANATPIASLALDGNYTLTAAAGSNTVVSVIKNGASGTIFDVTGTGTVLINGNSTYSGGTTIGTGAFFSIGAGSTTGDLTIGGTVTGYTGGTVSDAGTLEINRSNAYTFNGLVTGAGGLAQVGAGTTTLMNNSNNYTGPTTISAGILSVSTIGNGANSTGSAIGSASNVASNLIIDGGTLQYTGVGESTDRLIQVGISSGGSSAGIDASGSGALNFTNTGSITFAYAGKPATVTFTGTSTAANTFAPKIGDDKYTNVVKTGAGTWSLTNANTYSNGTAVSAGTLLVNNTAGSGLGSGAVSVTGGTLGGAGFIGTGANSVTIGAGGTLAPGAIVGATTGALTLTTTGTTTINGTLAIALGSTAAMEHS